MMLDNFADRLQKANAWPYQEHIVEILLHPNPLLEALIDRQPPPPVTWRSRLSDLRYRVRDAWDVLRGRVSVSDY